MFSCAFILRLMSKNICVYITTTRDTISIIFEINRQHGYFLNYTNPYSIYIHSTTSTLIWINVYYNKVIRERHTQPPSHTHVGMRSTYELYMMSSRSESRFREVEILISLNVLNTHIYTKLYNSTRSCLVQLHLYSFSATSVCPYSSDCAYFVNCLTH